VRRLLLRLVKLQGQLRTLRAKVEVTRIDLERRAEEEDRSAEVRRSLGHRGADVQATNAEGRSEAFATAAALLREVEGS
jgi:hypothetical protein